METEILNALVRANLAAGLAILLVLAVRRPVRDWFGARSAYALWLLAPVAALASLIPARRVIQIEAPAEASPLLAAPPAAPFGAPIVPPTFDAIAAPFPTPVAAALGPGPALDLTALAPPALLVFWVIGAAIAVGLLVWRQQRYLNSLGDLRPVTVDGLTLFRTERPGVGPALVGAVRPRIVLPADFEARFSAAERDLILAHERTHLASGDAQINAFIAACACLCWFNPLVHLAARRARQDQELACDSDVIARRPAARRQYAEALLKTQMAAHAVPLGCAWPAEGEHPLRKRIALLQAAVPAWPRRLVGAVMVTGLCLGGGAAAWGAQPPVVIVSDSTAATAPVARLAQAADPAAMPSAPASAALAFTAMPIEIVQGAALLQVIPEDRDDIVVSVTAGSRFAAPQVATENGRLIIRGELGEDAHRCRRRFDGVGPAQVPGVGAVAAAELPVIVLRTPRVLDLRVRGVVASRIGALSGGRVIIDGCGDAAIADASGPIEVSLYGLGNVDLGSVGGALTTRLIGVGDINAGPVAGRLTALMQGSGAMTVQTVAAGADLRMPGSGPMRVGAVTGAMKVSGSGSGSIDVASLRGPLLDIDLGGDSPLKVHGGETERMNVVITGSSQVSFGGRAREVHADLGPGARDVLIANADRIDAAPSAGRAQVIVDR